MMLRRITCPVHNAAQVGTHSTARTSLNSCRPDNWVRTDKTKAISDAFAWELSLLVTQKLSFKQHVGYRQLHLDARPGKHLCFLILASSASGVLKRQTLRKRTKVPKVGYATLRLRHGAPVDTDDIVDNFLSDPEFAQGPQELQNDDIRGLATTLANKRSIRYNPTCICLGTIREGTRFLILLWKSSQSHMAPFF